MGAVGAGELAPPPAGTGGGKEGPAAPAVPCGQDLLVHEVRPCISTFCNFEDSSQLI